MGVGGIYNRLQGVKYVTEGNKGFQGFKGRLKGVTGGKKELYWVSRVYNGLQKITGGYRR